MGLTWNDPKRDGHHRLIAPGSILEEVVDDDPLDWPAPESPPLPPPTPREDIEAFDRHRPPGSRRR